ncbi:GTPase HflX [Bacillus cereus Rock4-18]|nr:GTPase HflX [Bacillus cereus Rock4-18]
MNQLQPGQVYELHDVYVGSKDKLPTRIVVYKYTEEQKQKRLRDRAIREKKKGLYIQSVRNFYKELRYI